MEEMNMKTFDSKKEYENAVDSFFMETRGKLNTYLAVGAFGSLLYLSKIGRLRPLDITEIPQDLIDIQEMKGNNFLRLAWKFLGSIYNNIHSHGIIGRMLDYVLSIKKNYIHDAFEYSLEKLTIDKISSEHIQPLEIGMIASEMIKGMNLTVYNPFSGMMSYATQLDNYKFMRCVEINEDAMSIGIIRLALSDKGHNVAPLIGNVSSWELGKWDLIICTPPFGAPITMGDSLKQELGETISLSRFGRSTTEKGQLFTIVPTSFLWTNRKESTSVRKDLVDNDYIDTIVILPSNVFFPTAISTAIIYLNKQKEHQNIVDIVDATDCFIKQRPSDILDVNSILERVKTDGEYKISLTKEDIVKHNYKLDYNRYMAEENLVVPDGYILKKFKDVATPIDINHHFEETHGHLVTPASLRNDVYNCSKSSEDFNESDNLRSASKVTEPAILINTVGRVSPCIVTASEDNPVFINPMIAAYRVNAEIIEPEYLCLELSRRMIPVSGSVIQRIDRNELDEVSIVFPPSLEVQKQEYSELAKADKLAKARELGLQDLIDEMKAEYINEVRMRKHDMRPYLREIAAGEKLMRYYVKNMKNEADFESNMLDILNKCQNDIKQLSTLLENLSKEEKFGKPELVNIDRYLSDSPLLQDTDKYACDYFRDEDALDEAGLLNPLSPEKINQAWEVIQKLELKKEIPESISGEVVPGEYPDVGPDLLVSIAPADLDRIVENIVSNSVNHGFTDPERDNYSIWRTLSFDAKRNMFVIDFADNGKPLPEGMDKERFGLRGEKAGATAGTGLGGSIVKEIVKHYGGDYDIFSNGEGTTVRIWLPVAKKEEE